MYPNLYYAFKDIFGSAPSGLRFINSFGFFVALSFLAAAYVLTIELKRKERTGLLTGQDVKMVVGKQASPGELLLNFLLGFLLGYKIIGLFISGNASGDPQQFIFSSEGNLPVGLGLGVLFAGLKWWEKHKQKLDKPEERTIRIWPHDRVGDLVIYAALFGFLGAKIFHNLENWNDFVANPVEALLSFSGLTFYGGLICAAVAIWFYTRKHKINFTLLCDAIAPALILAYSLGRIGCQVAGDGDWGVLNSAYVTEPGPKSKVVLADTATFQRTLQAHGNFYLRNFQVNNTSEIPHISVKAPGWLPNWLFAYTYPHNVVNEGAPIPGCTEEQYCNQLPIPVFPTPFYETIMAFLLFLLLWSLRKKLKAPGTLFGVYLIVNGIERFLIEQIRVNTKYSIFGFHPTQAEIIAVLLVIGGAALYFIMKKKYETTLAAKA
ncbi:diacylglyceryl transferase [Niastella yeongjuensis]|uniref:Diacylglyceryl transferase n=1 Tax=Niastella yeongjuensis TaxID=354355 RepID=A0A1V9E4S4_9BACT|nr:prolipoprotein diacylglyceryl transferase family protein [Niastella yeongjuensis]OQP41024.1 diacylglyceryl transferase [Niastella yeongjuensis]SEO94550.1 Prolipoprotein diacylglyceryl transferase [Niastella yeongjuensis]